MTFTEETIVRTNQNPLYQVIGIRIEAVSEGSASAVLAPRPEVCWPTEGQPHGGILFTVLDTTMAFAALSNGEPGTGCATVDCSIQYTAPARRAPYRCTVATVRKTGRTVFVRGQVDDAAGEPVALAQATFRLFAPRGA